MEYLRRCIGSSDFSVLFMFLKGSGGIWKKGDAQLGTADKLLSALLWALPGFLP